MGAETIKLSDGEQKCPTFTDMVKAIILTGDILSAEGIQKLPIAASRSVRKKADPRREDILMYVERIHNLMTDNWKANYRKWWGEIIDHETIAAVIYQKGRQKGTSFNRNLVGNIISYLGHRGMMKTWNASKITVNLENTEEHSVRASLGKEPPSDIQEILKSYLK